MAVETARVRIDRLRATCEHAVCRAGFAENEAVRIVDVLLHAELRGNNQGPTKIAEGAVTPDPCARARWTLSESGGVVQIDAGRRNGILALVEDDIESLRAAGCDDGEILEVNQVCAYFNYSNRLLTGLGVTTEGDIIGYYKDDGADV